MHAAVEGSSRSQLKARRWMRATTLRRQLITWLAGPLFILWSVSTVIGYDIAKRFVNLAFDRALLEAALDISRQVRVVNNRIYLDLPEVALEMLQTHESGRLHYLVTGPGEEYISGEPDLPRPLAATSESTADRVHYYDEEFRGAAVRAVALRAPVVPGSGRGAVQIHVAEHLTARDEFARQIILRMALPQGVLILLAGLAVWYGVGRGLAPLSTLRGEIENRSHRDLSALSEEQAPQEVRPVIHAMNDLLARVEAAIADQQRFIADAAHQLRTPIAGLKTQMELALRLSQPGTVHDTLLQLQTATEQSARLVNQLLTLARAEPGARRGHAAERLDLARLARDTTTEWVPRALARSIDLGYDGEDGAAWIEGDPFLVRDMLGNLLDNAIRYTQRGGQVTVRVAAEPATIGLSVEDNGPGIPESERERVFERFYRVLGTGTEGCGLGLAIVREIALSHHAHVALAAGAGGRGTLVRVTFPRAA
jgi:two-component system sensor histidine kinase TctE